jgi:S-(hydroxymethyl)glutathione dehydrogenase/alcohol dehydrogenase
MPVPPPRGRRGGCRRTARKFGATDVVNAKVDAVEAVVNMTSGGVHYSFEAIGLKVTTEQAFRMLRKTAPPRSSAIPVGTMIERHGAEFLMERKIQGSNMGSNRFRVDMPRFVDFYLNGKLHLDDMISGRIKLKDVNDAMQALKKGEVARSVIMFDA